MADFQSWSWASQHVQIELQNGEYVSAESALILAGPPRLDILEGQLGAGELGADINAIPDRTGPEAQIFPVGLISDLTLGQNRPLQRIFEIGSKRSYFVVGRIFTNFALSRVKFYGPSLLRVLYAYYPTDKLAPGIAEKLPDLAEIDFSDQDEPAPILQDDAPGYGNVGGLGDGKRNRDFWINFGSQVFSHPFGLCLVLRSANDKNYGACYLQDAFLENHGLNINSAAVMMAETASGQADSVRPIQLLASEDQL